MDDIEPEKIPDIDYTKSNIRNQLNNDINKFLQNGGKIIEYPNPYINTPKKNIINIQDFTL